LSSPPTTARNRGVANSKGDVSGLSASERLDLIEQIWNSLDGSDVPVTEKQKAELDRRNAEMDRDGERGIPRREVMDRIHGRSK
jgi:putative addiction module component (TIGR02574 family)